MKFRREPSLFARGRGAARHCLFRLSGKGLAVLSSHYSVSQHCQKQRDGDNFTWQYFSLFSSFCFFPTISLLLPIYFKLFLSVVLVLLLLSFPPVLSFSPITWLLSHRQFVGLSLFFPSRFPHQSKETVTQRKNKNWTCANAMGQEATYGTSKSQSHEEC